MRDSLVLTVLGADRTGLVELLAHRIAAAGGNWEDSRMARLAGQFAGILLITVDRSRADELVAGLRDLDARGLQVTVRTTAPPPAPVGTRVRLELTGHDRPGIVRDVSQILSQRAVNVEELESSVGSAPMSGDPLFRARARLLVPHDVTLSMLRSALEALANDLIVDLTPE